ncbi:MAG: ATPase [Chloroflexota bacterium]
MTRSAIVDRDQILDLVDQLRVAIPEEVRAAKRINAEGERIMEKADEEAGRIISRAQEQAAFLIGERGLLERAEAEGLAIIDEARTAAEGTRAGADDYALGLLETLEVEVGKALAGVQKGIAVLDDRRAELAEAGVEASFDDEAEDENAGYEDDATDDEGDDQSRYR